MAQTKYAAALLLAGGLLGLAGCAVTPPEPVTKRNSELTHGNVQLHLRVGETTQAEVLEKFGAPNVTTVDGAGREVWTYQRSARAAQSSSDSRYWTLILLGGASDASGFETTSRMITLLIKFDAQGIVVDFKSRASNF